MDKEDLKLPHSPGTLRAFSSDIITIQGPEAQNLHLSLNPTIPTETEFPTYKTPQILKHDAKDTRNTKDKQTIEALNTQRTDTHRCEPQRQDHHDRPKNRTQANYSDNPSNPDNNQENQQNKSRENTSENLQNTKSDTTSKKGPDSITKKNTTKLSNMNIVTHNINGLRIETSSNRAQEIAQKMSEQAIDVLLIQEINTNVTHPKARMIIQQVQQSFPGLQMIWSHTKYVTHSTYKPGGTAIWVRPPLSQRIVRRLTDPLGRWAGVTVQLKNQKHPITILSVYQPPKAQVVKGTTNVTAQQTRWIQDNNISISPRQLFRKDLNTLVQSLLDRKEEVIIGGDLNEHQVTNNIIEDLIEKRGLYEILQVQDGEKKSTYKHGPHALDTLLTTRHTREMVYTVQSLGFNDFIPSDHNPIQATVTLKFIIPKNTKIERRLHAQNANQVSVYIEKLHHKMTSQKIFHQIEQLETKEITPTILNHIDKQLTKLRIQTEKGLKRYPNDGWHRLIPIWKKELILRNSNIKKLSQDNANEKKLINKERKKRNEIVQKFRQQAREGYAIRHKTIQEDITRLYQENPRNTAKIADLKRIMYVEKIREVYRKIKTKTTTKKHQEHKLEILEPNGIVTILQDTEEIAQQISTYNQQHFAQAKDTPLAKINYNYLEHKDEQEKSTSQYPENQDNNMVTPDVKKFLRNITKKPEHVGTDIITPEEWSKIIRRWKERTTTSPSGLHLGHHKALLMPHRWTHEQGENKNRWDDMQSQILESYLCLLNKALENGIALERWKIVHSVAIQKDQDNKYLHRIRNIHIFEADYNLILKLKWKQAVHESENREALHPSQYGSRKYKQSTDPVMLEIMQQEISRMARIPYIQVNYDAQACYDRIIPSIALYVSRKHGVHPNVLNIFQDVLENTRYIIKLGDVVTKKHYGKTNTQPFFGTGQGSGNSPHIWTLISTELFNLYEEKTQGAIFLSPYGDMQVKVSVTAYVDDVNSHHTSPKNDDINYLLQETQKAAQEWNDLLYISGGKLSSSKCTFYVSTQQLSSTGKSYAKEVNAPSLKINDRLGGTAEIEYLKTNHAHKSLGYYQSWANPTFHQEKTTSKKMEDFRATIRSTVLNYQEANIYYRSIFKPKVTYLTQLSSIPEAQAHRMTKQNIPLILNKMGYSSKTPTGITMGQQLYGGLQMLDIRIEQGTRNLMSLAKHISEATIQGSITQMAFKWWWYTTGTQQNPFSLKLGVPSHTESIWFQELHKFVWDFDIQVKVGLPFYQLERENDQFIMDIVILQNYSRKTAKHINMCRLFLSALTISDITNASGTHIDLECHKHSQAKKISTSNNQNSVYHKPNKSTWHYWEKFLNNITHANSRRLLNPLGLWTINANQIRKRYTNYTDQISIYTRNNNGFQKEDKLTGKSYQVIEIPENSTPCSLTLFKTPISTQRQQSNPIKQSITTKDIDLKGSRDIIIVSDATVQQAKSAWAWIATTSQGIVLERQKERIAEWNNTSFRAEALGVLAALRSLHSEIKKCDAQWKFYCDNQALIKRLQHIQTGKVQYEWTDSDVLMSIKNYIPDKGTFEHVKGHQLESEDLPLPARLNIMVDKMANEAIQKVPQDQNIKTIFQIKGNDSTIFNVPELVKYCQTKISMNYWKKRLGMEAYESIDWSVHQDIAKHFQNQQSIIKLMAGITPTKKRLARLGETKSSICPLCTIEEEDTLHILICKNNPDNINSHQQEITDKLKKYGDHTDIITKIIQKINHPDKQITETRWETQQSLIGWDKFIQGKIVKDWNEAVKIDEKKKYKSKTIITQIMIQIIRQWKRAWIYRLNLCQKNCMITQKEISNEENKRKLQSIYDNKSHLPTEIKKVMMPTIQDHLKKSNENIDNWLSIHYESIKGIIKQRNKHANPEANINYTPVIACEASNGTSEEDKTEIHYT
jgi:endonuclease/exonuclease/phosphatase family metal-dependent hydrolase